MQRFASLLVLILCFCQPKTPLKQQADLPLLQKSMAYHDSQQQWQHLKARLYLLHKDTAGQETPFEVEIDNTTGYFAHVSHQDDKEIVKGVSADGVPFFLLNGSQTFSEEEQEKYGLTPKSALGTRNFYLHLYGLPMKLTDTGTQVLDSVYTENFHGKEYQVIQVSYEPTVGNDHWHFYFNPHTAAMEAYSFHWGDPQAGEYVLLNGTLTIQGIRLPKERRWYFTHKDQYLGTDILLKAEKLNTHRI